MIRAVLGGGLIPYFDDVPGPTNQTQIKWNRGTYPSDSYNQENQKIPRRDDIAVIIKAQNPWAAQRKVLIIAGIRGFGTWGAAELLKKWWKDLYRQKDCSRKRRTTKQGDFAAVVAVHYEDLDIKAAKLLHPPANLEPAYFQDQDAA